MNDSTVAKRFLFVGAGFSGSVLARQLVESMDCTAVVIDRRQHIGGNCHTSRDAETGVMIHHFGPHIFNTSNEEVWELVQRFSEFGDFINRVKAVTPKGMFQLPINLLTINQFYGKEMRPDEARAFVAQQAKDYGREPENFEEQAISLVGEDLYFNFFEGYTRKQWGCDPKELPASIIKRLPLRFNYDDNYYNKKYQGIPVKGYSGIIEGLLDHPSIEVRLGEAFQPGVDSAGFDHVFYTGPIDAYFGFDLGRLAYRTVTFERIDAVGDYQGAALINYTSADVPYTRIHEHKHFAPWEEHEKTVAFREFSKETEPDDEPYYPKRLAADKVLLKQYRDKAMAEKDVTFLGRLATYRYMDMEKVIGEAMVLAREVVAAHKGGQAYPIFPNDEP